MTRLDPRILLRRLLVAKEGRPVLDIPFHEGVNIIAGENGSGKSTVADLIFYALGGDTPAWKQEAAACDSVLAEVELNDATATLRREISSTHRRPMEISWSELEVARKEAITGWQVYPFASTANKESFSQVLLRALGIPEAMRGEIASLLTMHQILRLLYVDQETSFSRIFRQDDFDTAVTRNAIGDLLLGLYEPVLYDLRLRLTALRKEYGAVNTQYRGAKEVLQTADAVLTVEMLEQARAESVEKRERLSSELEALEEQELNEIEVLQAALQEEREALRVELGEKKISMRSALDRLEALDFEIQDSELFISSLRRRLEALQDSVDIREALGTAAFAFCPACFATLPDRDQGRCHVCDSESGSTRADANVARLRHELHMQVGESERLQGSRQAERDQLAAELPGIETELRRLQREYDRTSSGARTGLEDEAARLNRAIGYVERELIELDRRIRIAQTFEELARRRVELRAEIASLEAEIEDYASAVGDRRGIAEEAVGSVGASILRADLDRQLKFQQADRITFDFGDDQLAVGDRTTFSASSMVLLKNAFHLALLFASLEHGFIRYPRFFLCDNVEDKGMELERSHNFQRVVVERSLSASVDHQIIFTTSMLNPDLDSPEFVVARFTPDQKSLQLS